jgi:hypothetical protein
MSKIIDYMHAWYSTHEDYDIDDIKKSIPVNSEVVIDAKALWGNNGVAERCIAELFVYLSGGMERPKFTLEDIIDDGDIAEHLSEYFSVNEDLLEDYLDTLLTTKTLREFGVSGVIGRRPSVREVAVRGDLLEPEVRTADRSSTSKNETIRLLASKLFRQNVSRIITNAQQDMKEDGAALQWLREHAQRCITSSTQIVDIEASSMSNADIVRTNVPAINTTDICAAIAEHSTSRGYSPMWKSSSTVLIDNVLSKLRANHGIFFSDNSEDSFLCYDPVGREWVAMMNNTGYDNGKACKAVGPHTAVGLSFGAGKASITSVRVGVAVKEE